MTVTTAFCNDLNYRSVTNASRLKLSFGFMAKGEGYNIFNTGHIVAAENHPLELLHATICPRA